MSKLKTKNLLKLIGSLILVVVLALSVIACNAPDDDDTAGGSESEEVITPVRNGEFIYYDDSKNPYAPSNWTWSSNYTIDDDDDSVFNVSGVIDTSSSGFDKNKDAYNISTNPSKVGEDDYVLMINNLQPYSAKYKSAAITLEAGKFYKLTLSVKTNLDTTDNGGANVAVTTSGTREYLAFKSMKNTEWTQVTMYLEAKKTTSTSVYLILSLGEGSKGANATLAKGSAFFDNIVLTAYEDTANQTAEELYEIDSNDGTNPDWTEDTHATYDFSLPNAEFNNKSTTSTTTVTATPYDWSTKKGADENGNFQASTSGLTRGVIDVTAYKPTKGILKEEIDNDDYKITKPEATKGNNVLMIYFTDPASPSAFGYSSTTITFETEKEYKLSFWVRTLAIKDNQNKSPSDGGKQVGAAIQLGDDVIFEGIDTQGAWVQYSIYVKGSATQNISRSLCFWLGQGWEGNESGYASGAAFFDGITLTEVSYPNSITDTESKIDLHRDNIITTNAFTSSDASNAYVKTPDSWSGEYAEDHGNPADGTTFGAINLDNYDGNTQITAENPDKASATREGSNLALVIQNSKPAHYIVNYTDSLEVYSNTAYRLSLWVKTDGIDLSKGIKIDLIDVNAEEDSEVLTSLSSINTQYEDDDEDTDILLNKWTEVVFTVLGHQIEDNAIAVRITIGSGNNQSPDYVKGTVFVSNMYYETISYTEYNSSSSSNTSANYTFRTESSASVKNSGFNYIDIDKTSKTDSLENGKITNSPAIPSYWTGSFVNDLSGQVEAGIVNGTAHQNLGLSNFPYDDGRLNDYSAFNGEPNLLMIWAKDETAYSYVSQSYTLTASSYYKVFASVKTNLESGNAYVSLLSGNKNIVSNPIDTTGITGIDNEDGWVKYEFYVKVGLNSASVNISLSLGLDEDNLAKGQAYFDNIYYKQIASTEYKEAVESNTIKKVSLTTNSFETTSSSYPATPTSSNFNGAAMSGAPSGTAYTVAGIVSNNHYDVDEMEAEFGDPIKDEYEDGKFIGANNTPEFLIIYNKADESSTGTAYNFTSNNYAFIAESYYKVTFYAKTLQLSDGDSAYAILSLTDIDTLTLNLDPSTAVDPDDNGWAKYTFYVKTADVNLSNVNITFGLGKYEKDDDGKVLTDKYATGYAMFDELTIEDIDEETYNSETLAIDNDTSLNAQKIAIKHTDEKDTGTSEDENVNTTTPLSLWEIIGIVSGAMLSIALVAVLVAVFVKKMKPRMQAKKTKRFKKPTYDKRKANNASRDKLNKYKD